MSRTRTPPRLSAWRDRLDARAQGVYAALPVPLRTRTRRLAYAFLPILQCGLAAGLAWFLAANLLGHPAPFFAPIAAAIALVESGKVDLAPFITGRIGLDHLIDEGFDTLINRNETAVKILVSPEL